jgi:pimeloyl-ACP methyl ester carboxylesterase
MGSLDVTSFPVAAGAFAIWVVLVFLVVRSLRHRTRAFAMRIAMWTAIGMSGTALALHASGTIPTDIPRWFYAIALIPFVGPAIAFVGWRKLRSVGRVAAVCCLPLGMLASILIANEHYAYWPTVDALLGKDHADPMLPTDLAFGLAQMQGTETPLVLRHTELGADNSHGYLIDLPIPGSASGFHAQPALAWLPPSFIEHPERARSVIEFIGGSPSWPSDWTRAAGLDVLGDRIAARNGGEAPIMVMVDANGAPFGDTECVDGPRGNAETYLSHDVPDYIAHHFATSVDPANWGIVGYSEGGTCALTLTLRHPDRFRSFVDLAGDRGPNVGGHRHTVKALFGGSESRWTGHDPTSMLTSTSFPQIAGWFAAGADDTRSRHCNEGMVAAAHRAGLVSQTHVVPGGHDFNFVRAALADALPWISGRVMSRV